MSIYESAEVQRAQTRFIRQSMNEPLLGREEEFELARAWREDEDEASLHKLIRSYTRLTVAIAAKFRNYGLPMSDLVQEGAIGLMQAAMRFDHEREVRFSTYASWWIRSSIQDYILRNWSIVRTGTTAAHKSLFFNLRRLRSRIEEVSGGGLNDEGRAKIATELSVNLHDVEHMEARLNGTDQSLNMTVGEDGDDEWMNFLADERAAPDASYQSHHDSRVRSEWIASALDVLDERERQIIEARRLTEDGATLEELGEVLGVSKERVRQLENRALGKMRNAILTKTDNPADLIAEL